jgi:hypothetical protein
MRAQGLGCGAGSGRKVRDDLQAPAVGDRQAGPEMGRWPGAVLG